MKYKNILVTGGAGFVGSSVCLKLKAYYPSITVLALDNLMRRGSELNLPRLKKQGIKFIHGDVRNKEDLAMNEIDLLIECSAEPSVMAGVSSSPDYLLNTNLTGAINCFELARKTGADVIFLSTSRVYPIKTLNALKFTEEETRYSLAPNQKIPGAGKEGINENFPIQGARSLYGTTKLAAELILQEYRENYEIKMVINRFGVITGPWQMGKIDQGVIVLWIARHMFGKPLSYIGFGGKGKQVRDILHINDLFDILNMQIKNIEDFDGEVYNIGGGRKTSVSLFELTKICQKITGNKIPIKAVQQDRPGDILGYISDNTKITTQTAWKPTIFVEDTCQQIHQWITDNRNTLQQVLE